MTIPAFEVVIKGKNETDKAARGAEDRLQRIPKRAKGAMGEMDKAIARSGRGILGTVSQIERASAGILSGRGAGAGGIVKSMSSLVTVGDAAAASVGEVAAAGGLLEGALLAIAGPGAIAVGVLAGVAIATDKVASSWAKGVLGASNFAATIGIATQRLQEFQAAGERVGVDKNTAAGALGGLAKTLDDARYGQNTNAAGTLALLGIKTKLKADGQVDTMAMVPLIAAAMAGRSAHAQRKIANNLGIGEAALPIFTQGPGKLAKDMTDARAHAAISTPDGEAAARRWVHDRTRFGQMVDRATARMGEAGARAGQGVLDQVGATGARMIDDGGASIAKGAEKFASSVVDKFAPAVRELASAVGGARADGTNTTSSLADRIQHLGERSRQNQVSPKGARGVMQLMPDTAREAAAWAHIPYDAQRMHTDAAYNRRLGEAYIDKLQHVLKTDDPAVIGAAYNAGPGVVLDWLRGTNNSHKNPRRRHLPDPRAGASDEAFIAGIPTNGGYRETHDYAARVAGGDVHHHHHITLEDRRVHIKTTSPGAKTPAVFQQIID